MGKIKGCFIQLKYNREVHRPGDTVSGVAILDIETAFKVRTITISCRGQTLNKWKKAFQEVYESDSIGTEIHFAQVLTVHTANPPALLSVGRYSYNFRFKMPNFNLPSSFEGGYGSTRYFVKLEVDKPFPSINDKFYKCFTVLSHIEVNSSSYLRSVCVNAQKPLSKVLGIGKAGTLTLTADIDRASYCPGEKILLNLDVKNQSTNDLGSVKASLVQFVKYNTSDDYQNTNVTICKIEGDKIAKGGNFVWTNQVMPVYAVPPSTKPGELHIIKVSYTVKIEVHVPRGLDLEAHIPVIIGTTALGCPVASRPYHAGNNLYVTNRSKMLSYARCSRGVQKFLKFTTDFPCITSFTPLTAYVQNYNRDHALAQLQTILGGVVPATVSVTTGASSAAAETASVTDEALSATNTDLSLALSDQESPEACGNAEENGLFEENPNPMQDTSNTNKLKSHDPPNSFALHNTPDVPPPTYEEALAGQMITTLQVPLEQGNGSILMLICPILDSQLLHNCLKENELQNGCIESFIPQVQLFPSEQTSALLIYFASEKTAIRWLQTMTSTNTELASRWWALIGENKMKLENTEDCSEHTRISVDLMKKNNEFKNTKTYSDEYTKLLKETLRPTKVKHGVVTLLSGKVVFAAGDWSSFPAEANELTLIVNKYPSLNHYTAFNQEYETNPSMKRYLEIVLMCHRYSFTTTFDVHAISEFHDQ